MSLYRSLPSLLEDNLKSFSIFTAAPMGNGNAEKKSLTDWQRISIAEAIQKQQWWNNLFSIILIAVQVVILFFCLALVWSIHREPNVEFYKYLFGGSISFWLPLFFAFIYVWKTKNQMDIFMAVMPLLPLEKLTDLAEKIALREIEGMGSLLGSLKSNG